ncbi:MAG: PAS domain-containing protein [Anaerolineales bacterium]|nr:PAS domain-containing protein [Anaerolineales bacterium]
MPVNQIREQAPIQQQVHNTTSKLPDPLSSLILNIYQTNLELKETQEWLVGQICKIFNTEGGSILLIKDSNAEQVVKVQWDEAPQWSDISDIFQQDEIIQNCLLQDSPSNIKVSTNKKPIYWLNAPDTPIHTMMCTLLVHQEQKLGVLSVFNKRASDFSEQDQKLLSGLANLISHNISMTRQVQNLKVINADLEVNHWQLLRSRNILRALFDSIPLSIYIIDRKYNLVAVNKDRAFRQDQLPNALVGHRCYEKLYHNEDICPECKVIESLFRGKNTLRTKRQWQPDGEPEEWEISTYPIYDDSNQVTQAIIIEEDVTDKRRLEATIAQSEKLAAVGQLAAGLAHEINNPLTAIIANTQLLQREIQPEEDMRELVDLIAKAGYRAAQVVRNLLDLARKEQYVFEPTDVNDTLRNALSLLNHEFMARSISLVFEPSEDLPPITGSPDHLQGVWLNLLTNAMDALENTANEIHVTSSLLGSEIRVIVSDNGKGIPPERLNRIFEPFYTTKAPGRGTGLGLSLCHRVIKQHGGHILVDSQLGVGTKFTVILPVA